MLFEVVVYIESLVGAMETAYADMNNAIGNSISVILGNANPFGQLCQIGFIQGNSGLGRLFVRLIWGMVGGGEVAVHRIVLL